MVPDHGRREEEEECCLPVRGILPRWRMSLSLSLSRLGCFCLASICLTGEKSGSTRGVNPGRTRALSYMSRGFVSHFVRSLSSSLSLHLAIVGRCTGAVGVMIGNDDDNSNNGHNNNDDERPGIPMRHTTTIRRRHFVRPRPCRPRLAPPGRR
jgi:hypothetical protein